MVEIICKYCGDKVEAKRQSKIICDKGECQNKYHAEKNREKFDKHPDKYDEHQFKMSQKNKKISLQKWNQINREINGDNSLKIKTKGHICESCQTEFIAGGGRNYTPWYAAVCPKCGLVEKSLIDTDIWEHHLRYQPHPADKTEFNEWIRDLRKVEHYPILKKYAIYLDVQKITIDFPQELIALRILLNKLKERKDKKEIIVLTTPEEEQICFKALNEKLIKNKNLINK